MMVGVTLCIHGLAMVAPTHLMRCGPIRCQDYGRRFLPPDTDALRRRSGDKEPKVEVRAAGGKGQGAFAAEVIQDGQWVSQYVGTLMRDADAVKELPFDPLGLMADGMAGGSSIGEAQEPRDSSSEYVLELAPGLYIDADNSTHFSRFFNHAEHGNLAVTVNVAEQRADFFASRRIEVGEEITFDYGEGYWYAASLSEEPMQPMQGTDSRNFALDPDMPFRDWCAARKAKDNKAKGGS